MMIISSVLIGLTGAVFVAAMILEFFRSERLGERRPVRVRVPAVDHRTILSARERSFRP